MPLKLSISGGNERGTRMLAAGTLSIGRGERNDWRLADPERHLSKTHCVISVEGGRYILTDLSTNGIYINGARQPTVRDSRLVLTDGDQFRLGDYTVSVEEVAGSAGVPPGQVPHGTIDPLYADPLDDPLRDPLGRAPDPAFRHPIHHAPPVQRAEDPFDRMDESRRRAGGPAPSPADDMFAGTRPVDPWAGPSQPDHADALNHAMPLPVNAALPTNPMDIDFDALIGDLSALQLQAPPASQVQPQTQPQRPVAPTTPPALQASGPVLHDPFAELDDLVAPAAAAPLPAAARPPVPAAPPRTDASSPMTPPPTPSPAPASPDAMRAAMLAFLQGAGVPASPFGDDAEAALRNAGQVFRALADGLREVLMSRAAVKAELRVEQTLLRATNNNPLKFSFSPDDAVAALLSPPRPGYMPPLTAAREAIDDVKMHEIAVVAGMQTALMALLRRFDPETLEGRLTQNMFGSVLPATRKARLWESFRDLYATIASEAEDDFQAVFGRAFAKAYKAQSGKE